MKTQVATGITISSVDYLEKDKIITVLLLSGERVSMRARGVNSPKAKLKFACELFSLCEFEFSISKNPLLITATPKHMFWGIRESVEKLYLACFPLENIAEGEGDGKFLLASLSFLEVHDYSRKMAVKYIFQCLKHLGIGFSAVKCISCGGKISRKFAFDFDGGGFRCENCGGENTSSLAKTMQLVEEFDMHALGKINFTKAQELEMLNLLFSHHANKTGENSKSLAGLLAMENMDI